MKKAEGRRLKGKGRRLKAKGQRHVIPDTIRDPVHLEPAPLCGVIERTKNEAISNEIRDALHK